MKVVHLERLFGIAPHTLCQQKGLLEALDSFTSDVSKATCVQCLMRWDELHARGFESMHAWNQHEADLDAARFEAAVEDRQREDLQWEIEEFLARARDKDFLRGTGRFSSEPNLQNIASRTAAGQALRNAFIGKKP